MKVKVSLTGLKSRCQRAGSFWRLQERMHPWPLPTPRSCQHSSAHGHIALLFLPGPLASSSSYSGIFLSLPLIRTLMIITFRAMSDRPAWPPHLEIPVTSVSPFWLFMPFLKNKSFQITLSWCPCTRLHILVRISLNN